LARTLETFDFATADRGTYQWRQWLDGQIWQLRQGEDFKGKPQSFANSARRAATRAGRRLEYVIEGDTVTLRARAGTPGDLEYL
jgi:hypothetical protein